ncbi:hypothetical protein ACE6H2_003076 [Prunus campanulata]
MEKKPSFKFASLALLLLFSAVAVWKMPGAEARGKLRCPRMIDCSKVCQGFPWRCVNGDCICDGGNPPPKLQVEANCEPNQLP